MRLLVLGGTQFVGYLAAEEAVARGHDVTIFNRGTRAGPEGTKLIKGDRLAPDGYAALKGLLFDAVIDTWASDAEVVKSAVEALRGSVGHYTFVSSIVVYNFANASAPFSEDAPLTEVSEPSTNAYVRNKIQSEQEAMKSGVPTLLARAGFILGPHESLDGRLPWWLRRMQKGGPTLAAGPRDLPVQFIDGRDLANFLVDGAECQSTGAFNLTAPMEKRISFETLLETINQLAGNRSTLCWLTPQQAAEANVRPLGEMPLWATSTLMHYYQMDATKAITLAGLKTRPALETITDTWNWYQNCGETLPSDGKPLGCGINQDKETQLLNKYF